MGSINLTITTAPNETAYDVDNPTRSTELYCNQMHTVIEDMDDSGTWYINDGVWPTADREANVLHLNAMMEEVFDYAAEAIEDHRNEDPIGIAKPSSTLLTKPSMSIYYLLNEQRIRVWEQALKLCWLIYYMWKTELDPLLLKEKLQELLIAWPLQETTIELADDLGQQFKVYPSWKNADL